MKAANVNEPLECEDCGKLCHGIQGIRGHRRSCPGRKTRSSNQVKEVDETVVEPGSLRVPASNQQETLAVGSIRRQCRLSYVPMSLCAN